MNAAQQKLFMKYNLGQVLFCALPAEKKRIGREGIFMGRALGMPVTIGPIASITKGAIPDVIPRNTHQSNNHNSERCCNKDVFGQQAARGQK